MLDAFLEGVPCVDIPGMIRPACKHFYVKESPKS